LRCGYLGSKTLLARYFLMVFRDRPVRLAISRIGIWSRKCQRLMLLNIATLITPVAPAQIMSRTVSIRGSDLDAIQQSSRFDSELLGEDETRCHRLCIAWS
jgi:hypothetical protein